MAKDDSEREDKVYSESTALLDGPKRITPNERSNFLDVAPEEDSATLMQHLRI